MDPNKFNRTVFISDNLPFLKALDGESVDLIVIDPPFGKKQTFTGQIEPPLSEDEKRIERDLMLSWGVSNPATAYELGLEYPDQTGSTANFRDIWDFRVRVYEDWLDELKDINSGAYALIQSTRYTHGDGVAAYIAFMTERALEIERVLKPTGSVYLHCDHTANAYLRQMMDAVFGAQNFRNEIVWGYHTGGVSKNYWPRKHDTLLFYVKSDDYKHKPLKERQYYQKDFFGAQVDAEGNYYADVYTRDVWEDIKPLINVSKERTGYPTQKPQALAQRMIEASSSPGDLVMDCFAGCAYVPVAAELNGRRWLACDMSPRAWTVVRRQFHKHPKLKIITEGELSKEDGVQTRIGDRRVIKARGPNDIPQPVSDGASGASIKARRKGLAKIVFKQRPLETPQQIWDAFVKEWGPMCWYCDAKQRPTRPSLHLDHIESYNPDGSNNDCWNRALACPDCNSAKGAKLTPQETIELAFEAGRIAAPALRDEQLVKFETRRKWARERYNKLKQRQK